MNFMPRKKAYKSTLDFAPSFEKPRRTFHTHKNMQEVCNYWETNPTGKRIFVYEDNPRSIAGDHIEVHEIYTVEDGVFRTIDKPRYFNTAFKNCKKTK